VKPIESYGILKLAELPILITFSLLLISIAAGTLGLLNSCFIWLIAPGAIAISCKFLNYPAYARYLAAAFSAHPVINWIFLFSAVLLLLVPGVGGIARYIISRVFPTS